MLILKNNNIIELVANMLNFEHNYKLYDPELNIIPNAEKFPIIEVSGKKMHYKATCGVIYYNPYEDENTVFSSKLSDLIIKIHEIISNYEEHLLIKRPTAITGSCVVKQNLFKNGTYMLKMKNPYIRSNNEYKFPARALILLPTNYKQFPPHYSTRSSFTWYFIPMNFNFKIYNMYSLNSIISSIYIDYENLIKYNHNDIIYDISCEDYNKLNIININIEHYKFLITEGNNLSRNLFYVDTRNRNFKFSKFNLIKSFDDIKYINDEKKCNSCDDIIDDFAIGAPLIDNNEKYDKYNPNIVVSIFCINCWLFRTEGPKKKYYLFSIKKSVPAMEIYDNIFFITKENFINSIPDEHLTEIIEKLNIFNLTDILLINTSIKNIVQSTFNIMSPQDLSKYIIIPFNRFVEHCCV